MTQDKYMSRGRVHTDVAALLDRTIKNKRWIALFEPS